MENIGAYVALLIKYLPSIVAVLTAILQAIAPGTVTGVIDAHPVATGVAAAGTVIAAQLTRSPVADAKKEVESA